MKRAVLCLGVALVGSAMPAFAQEAPRPGTTSWVKVVVTGEDVGSQTEVVRAVSAAGGRSVTSLAVIHGASAALPAASVAQLRTAPGVRSVSVDGRGRLQGIDSTLGYDVAGDEGSLYSIGQVTHAKDAWNKGFTGKGVDVALIDSGVVPVKGLTSGNVVSGPDLSFESQDPALQHLDTFGHGTHMASIIAGRDSASSGSVYAKADSHSFNGIAPDARVVSVKVAASDGACDVSQVIGAIDWVAQHAHDNGLNIRVLNLSYGTDSTQDAALDPLDFAVENAWRAGIAVVVSSGNDGTHRAAVADPANDPLVIAVGAADPNDTDSVGDDKVPAWVQVGTAGRHVDLIAPGLHVLGLRNPGSNADLTSPSARVGTRFFRGTGTSQAAAVVSGLAALYLQKYPAATPDQVKRALVATSSVPSSAKSTFGGLGVPDIAKALGAALPSLAGSAQSATGATGLGSLEGARGSSHVARGSSTLTGETDIFGKAWDAASWATASAQGTSWSGGSWRGTRWTNGWSSAGSWDGGAWSDPDWTGQSWGGQSWGGHTWSESGWDGQSWGGQSWGGQSWGGQSWGGQAWGGQAWGGQSWATGGWE